MCADVCSCLFTVALVAVTLPDILLPYLHRCKVCKVVPVTKGMSAGFSSWVPLHTLVKKSQACAFEEPGSAEINLCDPPALGEMQLRVGQRCCRGQHRPEQVQPPASYLWAPLPTKLPGSKSAESGVKKCLHLLEVKDLKTDSY